MSAFFFICAFICMIAVVVSMGTGLFAMNKEGQKAREKSNKSMRFRILFQGLAILFLFLAYLASK